MRNPLLACRQRTAALAVAGLSLLAACSPAFDWREKRMDEERYSVAVPARPQVEERDLPWPPPTSGLAADAASSPAYHVSILSTGVGQSLFSVTVVHLPPSWRNQPGRYQPLAEGFRSALVRNLGGSIDAVGDVAPPHGAAGAGICDETQAHGQAGSPPRPVRLALRRYVAEDRLYMVSLVAAVGEVPPEAAQTYFSSFRILAAGDRP